MFGEKVILVCIVGLILNLFGAGVAELSGLPVYLDTPGTIFIAALGGYMPGIAVGFFTNLLRAGFDPQQMYFSSISILVAIFTAFFAKKGFFDSFGKMIFFIPVLALSTGTFDLIIESFLKTASVESLTEVKIDCAGIFSKELIDKIFSSLLAFALLQLTPPQIKKSFKTFGRRQASLSDETDYGKKKFEVFAHEIAFAFDFKFVLCFLFNRADKLPALQRRRDRRQDKDR